MKRIFRLVGCMICLVGCNKASNEVMNFVGSNEEWLGIYSVTEVAGQVYSTLTIQPLSKDGVSQPLAYELSDVEVIGQIENGTTVHDDQIGVVNPEELKMKGTLALKISYDGHEEVVMLKSAPPKADRFRWSLIH